MSPGGGSGRRAGFELGPLAEAVEARLDGWGARQAGVRLWRRDRRLWSAEPLPELEDRLGWLELPAALPALLDELEPFAAAALGEGLDTVVLLGMGGSSLGAEMLQGALGEPRRLRVGDSTHPEAVRRLAAGLDPRGTLFVVSSKSGATVETDSLMRYFWEWLGERLERPAERFVAVTDAGSALAHTAAERGFRRIFEAPADVGGRYSVLGPFGMVPAALGGLALRPLQESAAAMAGSCGPTVAVGENPGMVLGAFLGEAARAGRSTLKLAAGPPAEGLVPWLEQLIAESTGKDGRGILPVPAEPRGAAGAAGRAVLAALGTAADAAAGEPRATLPLPEPTGLGGEVFRWEVAVAMASAVIGVHPFDQPDVQLAKQLAQRAVRGEAGLEAPPVATPGTADLEGWLGRRASYLGVHAFLAPRPETDRRLELLRRALGRRSGLAVTAAYGPRFLHSTGQLHKGGPAGGGFLQLLDRPAADLEIPGGELSFGRLLRAQADGDAAALVQRGRSLLRVDLGAEPEAGLERLLARLEA